MISKPELTCKEGQRPRQAQDYRQKGKPGLQAGKVNSHGETSEAVGQASRARRGLGGDGLGPGRFLGVRISASCNPAHCASQRRLEAIAEQIYVD